MHNEEPDRITGSIQVTHQFRPDPHRKRERHETRPAPEQNQVKQTAQTIAHGLLHHPCHFD